MYFLGGLFFLKQVGGTRALFLLKRFEKCSGMAVFAIRPFLLLDKARIRGGRRTGCPACCCGTLLDVLCNIWAGLPLSSRLRFLKYDLTPRGMMGFP